VSAGTFRLSSNALQFVFVFESSPLETPSACLAVVQPTLSVCSLQFAAFDRIVPDPESQNETSAFVAFVKRGKQPTKNTYTADLRLQSFHHPAHGSSPAGLPSTLFQAYR